MLSKTDISALYVALFNRAPEGDGLNAWLLKANTENLSLAQTASLMLQTDAAQKYYADIINDNEKLVKALYKNLLNKSTDGAAGTEKDPEGIKNWINYLDQNKDVSKMIEDFFSTINLPVNNDEPAAKLFKNKVAVAEKVAEVVKSIDLSKNDQIEKFQAAINSVSPTTTTEQIAQIAQSVKDGSIDTSVNENNNNSNANNQTNSGNSSNSGGGSSSSGGSSSGGGIAPTPPTAEEKTQAAEKAEEAAASVVSDKLAELTRGNSVPKDVKNALNDRTGGKKPLAEKLEDVQTAITAEIKKLKEGTDDAKIAELKELQNKVAEQQKELNKAKDEVAKAIEKQADEAEQNIKNLQAEQEKIGEATRALVDEMEKSEAGKIKLDDELDSQNTVLAKIQAGKTYDDLIEEFESKKDILSAQKDKIDELVKQQKQINANNTKAKELFNQQFEENQKGLDLFVEALNKAADKSVTPDILALETGDYVYLQHTAGSNGALGEKDDVTYVLDIGNKSQAKVAGKELFFNKSDHKIYVANDDLSAIESTPLSLENGSNGVYVVNNKGGESVLYSTQSKKEGTIVAKYITNEDGKILAVMDDSEGKPNNVVILQQPANKALPIAGELKIESGKPKYEMGDSHITPNYLSTTLSGDKTKIATVINGYRDITYTLKEETAIKDVAKLVGEEKLPLLSSLIKAGEDKFYITVQNEKAYITTHEEGPAVWSFGETENEFKLDGIHYQSGEQKPSSVWLLNTPKNYTTAKFKIDFDADAGERFVVKSFEKFQGESTGDDATKVANKTAHKKYIAKDSVDYQNIAKNKANDTELAKLADKALDVNAEGKVTAISFLDDQKAETFTLTTPADEADALKYAKAGSSGNDAFMLKNGDAYVNASYTDVKEPATDSLHYTVTEGAEGAYTLTIKKGEQAEGAKTTEVIKLADSVTSVFKFNDAGDKVKTLKIGDSPEFTLSTEAELTTAKDYTVVDLAGAKALASSTAYIEASYTADEKKYELSGVTENTAYTLTIKDKEGTNTLQTIKLANGKTTDTTMQADHTNVATVKISDINGVKTVKFQDSADTVEKVSIDLTSATQKDITLLKTKDAGGSSSDKYNAATNKLALDNLSTAELKAATKVTINSDVTELTNAQFSKLVGFESVTAIEAAQALKITAGTTLDVSKVAVSSGTLTEATSADTTAITLKSSANTDLVDLTVPPTAKALSITNFDKTADKVKIANAEKGTEVSTALELTDIKDADGSDNAKIKVDTNGLISFTKNDGSSAQTLGDLKGSDGSAAAEESAVLAAIQTALNQASDAGIANGVYLFNGAENSYLISLGATNTDKSDDLVITLAGVNDGTTVSVSSNEISIS